MFGLLMHCLAER